jgi:CHRD domain
VQSQNVERLEAVALGARQGEQPARLVGGEGAHLGLAGAGGLHGTGGVPRHESVGERLLERLVERDVYVVDGARSAATLGSAWAQTSTQTLELTPSRDSGVSGTATLTETEAGLEVQLDVQGLPSAEGTEHIAHIHEGATCADDRAGRGAPAEFPLKSVVNEGGAGSSTSTIDDSLDELSGDVPHYVNVHAEMTGEGTPPGIACADVAAATVPDTGSIVSPMTMLLLGGAALVVLATAGSVLARQRT